MRCSHCSTTPARVSTKPTHSPRTPSGSRPRRWSGCWARDARNASVRSGPRRPHGYVPCSSDSRDLSTSRCSPTATASRSTLRECASGCGSTWTRRRGSVRGWRRSASPPPHFPPHGRRASGRRRRRRDRHSQLARTRPPRHHVPLRPGERGDQAQGPRARRWWGQTRATSTLEARSGAARVAGRAVKTSVPAVAHDSGFFHRSSPTTGSSSAALPLTYFIRTESETMATVNPNRHTMVAPIGQSLR